MKAITKEHLLTIIKDHTYWNNGKTTVCILELINGFQVIGTSGVVNKDNFNEEVGKSIAFENAFNKLWELEGYVLQNQIANDLHN